MRPPNWACQIELQVSIVIARLLECLGAFIILAALSISTPTLPAPTHVRPIPHASAEPLPTLRLQAGMPAHGSPRHGSAKLLLPIWACWTQLHASVLIIPAHRGAFIILLVLSISTPKPTQINPARLILHASAECELRWMQGTC